MNAPSKPVKGVDRCDAISYQELLDQDPRAPAPFLREEKPGDLGLEPIKADRYTSEAFLKLEIEKVFLKTWQYVCRQEEIPNPGDTQVFEIVGHSVLVVRQLDGSIKAFRNICLHRGRRLVTSGGCKNQFKCPYHGFIWNTDGTFRENPMAWDFPQIEEKTFGLPPVLVDSWGGFIFINFDLDAQPLAEVAAPMPEHFAHWNIENCYKAAHVAKVVHANWKAVAEAFLEAHHVLTTHPQLSPYSGDGNSQYDVLSDHVTRFITPIGTPSPLIDTHDWDEQRLADYMMKAGGRAGQIKGGVHLEPGQTARRLAGDISRANLLAQTGIDHSNASDSEVVDGISYHLFPNFSLWGGFAGKICYRFRPHDRRVDQTLMEVLLFRQCPAGQPRPAPAPYHALGEDELWASASELGYLGPVYDQDQSNLPPTQDGLEDMGADGVVLFGNYSEVRCRHLHVMIDRYLAR